MTQSKRQARQMQLVFQRILAVTRASLGFAKDRRKVVFDQAPDIPLVHKNMLCHGRFKCRNGIAQTNRLGSVGPESDAAYATRHRPATPDTERAEMLQRSCSVNGFLHLIGHGVSEALMQRIAG